MSGGWQTRVWLKPVGVQHTGPTYGGGIAFWVSQNVASAKYDRRGALIKAVYPQA